MSVKSCIKIIRRFFSTHVKDMAPDESVQKKMSTNTKHPDGLFVFLDVVFFSRTFSCH